MRLSISTCFDYGVEFAKMLQLVAESGFRTVALGARREHSGYHLKKGRREIRALTSALGLGIDYVHAPIGEDGGEGRDLRNRSVWRAGGRRGGRAPARRLRS